MPQNIEIKARLSDFSRVETAARQLADSGPQLIEQEDVFFNCGIGNGRLKLRILSPGRGELIHYHRPDQAGPKTSEYLITRTGDPAGLRKVLTRAHGVRAVVVKTRHLYLAGRTRIHLDRVEGLGDFLELEVVLAENEPVEAGHAEATDLMSTLGIGTPDLVPGAYVDLLERQSSL